MSSRMDPYGDSKPDFAALARKNAKLGRLAIKAHQDGRGEYATIDFKDVTSSITLTEAILEHDFGIHCKLREDRLCPPIPARLSYLNWVEELLKQTADAAHSIFSFDELNSFPEKVEDLSRPTKRIRRDEEKRNIRILDIGTGASCIYPILGCALAKEWQFIGTDIDSVSLDSAKDIVEDSRNNEDISKARFTSGKQLRLKERIHLLLREPEQSLLLTEDEIQKAEIPLLSWSRIQDGFLYHAVMCNPPFYESAEDMQRSFDLKEEEPNAVCLGNESEMIYPGGEVAFVQKMILESRQLGERVLWFTSFIGLHRSLERLAKIFQAANITNVYFSPLQSGMMTRYVVAWTHTPYRLPLTKLLNVSSIKIATQENAVLMRQIQRSKTEEQIDSIATTLLQALKERHISWSTPCSNVLVVAPTFKTWGRQGKRALNQGLTIDKSREPIVGIRIIIMNEKITAQWVYGRDRSLFFSFIDEILMTAIIRT